MNHLNGLLFDFDGVLADTEVHHWRAWREVLKPYAIDLDWDTYARSCIGLSNGAMLEVLVALAPAPLTPEQLRAHYPEKRALFRALAAQAALLDQRLVKLISTISDMKFGVVSSSNRAEIEPILQREGILPFLQTTVFGDEVQHHKPHPEPYQVAVRQLGLPPAGCVVFEDSTAGLASARAAGCRVIVVARPDQLYDLVRAVLAEAAGARQAG